MWFNVGIVELGIVGVLLLAAAILGALRLRAWRWAIVGLACSIVATVLSPADPVSTVLLGAVLFLFFLGGIRFGRARSVAVA